MKIISKVTLGLATAAALFLAGCAEAPAPAKAEKVSATITEASLGLRKTNLYAEDDTIAAQTNYIKKAAGSGFKFSRAFENAPPMIPHDVEGMLPIKIGNNACIGCHAPEVAKSVNATPYPASHMTNFRPDTSIGSDGKITKNGKSVNNTSDFLVTAKKVGKLSGARYNCSQCHAPQSVGNLAVENTFEADFRNAKSASRSNLLDNINEGVDTTK